MLFCSIFGHSIEWFYTTPPEKFENGENVVSIGACNRCGWQFTPRIDITDKSEEGQA